MGIISRYPASRVLVAPDPEDSGTTLTVYEDDGDIFPTPPFTALTWHNQILPAVGSNACYLDVTAVDGDVLTFVRQDPTAAIYANDMIAVVETTPVVAEGAAYTVTSLKTGTGPFSLSWEDPVGNLGSVTNLDALEGTVVASRPGIWKWAFRDDAGEVVDSNEFFAQFSPA